MKTILPLLFFGVACRFVPRRRGRQAARPQGGALGELGATYRRRAAWQGGTGRCLGVHLHQLDPHLAICQGVESRLRVARPGRGRRALARVRVRQARREHRPWDSRPRADVSDRDRQRVRDLAGPGQRRLAGEVPLRRPGKAGQALGGRGALRRDRIRDPAAPGSGQPWRSAARCQPGGDGVREDRPALLRGNHERDICRS